ncbi:MAG: branched-chain amino acid ABC transporter permease [Haloferacaceae archaeon]
MVAASTLIEVTIDGLAQAMFLMLLGVGITLVFGLGEVLNLAIGMFAIGAILVAYTLVQFGLPVPVAMLVSVLGVGLFSLLVDKTLLELVYKSEGEERILLGIFVTLGLATMLEGLFRLRYSSEYTLRLGLPNVSVGSVDIVGSVVAIIVLGAIILVILFAFLRKTFLGKATRTVFQDEVGALIVGVDPREMRTLVFVLSSLVAAIAGVLFGLGATIRVEDSFSFTIFALIVAIVGGVRNIEGAVAAGFILGLVTNYANFFVGSYVASLILFAAAVIVLLVNPEVINQ